LPERRARDDAYAARLGLQREEKPGETRAYNQQ
jgi:hypothetical protein